MTSVESFDSDSKTFSYCLGYQISNFALNNSGNKIIVGAKDWELLNIGEDRFTSVNILSTRTFNFRVMDICWSKLDDTLVASCGSNGDLHKIIVTPTELKLENAYKFHDRTVNKIHFHPNEPNFLISGGQDGNIKLVDFRIRNENNPVSVFKQNAHDKVTDLQFNPSITMSHQFASGSESGSVYIWDTRNTKYEKMYRAHLGVVHLDWHPEEKYWLATATSSSDRQINVVDLSTDKMNSIHSITNSESVSSIKWRPKRKMQIGACLGGFGHLYIWDFMRPYVPYASFDLITNKVSNFMWRNGPKSIIASTRLPNNRSKLYNFCVSEAVRPADHSTLVSVEMDINGSIAFAVGVGDPKKPDLPKEPIEVDKLSSCSDNNEKFQITQSVLYFDDKKPYVRTDWFYYSSSNYKFKNGTFEELCDHNAQVAYSYKKIDVYKNWMILKTLYKENDKYELKEEDTSKVSSNLSNPKQLQSTNKLNQVDSNSTIQIPLSAFTQVATIVNASSSSNTSVNNSSSSSEITSDHSGVATNLENIPNSNSQIKVSKEAISISDKLNTFRQNENFYVTTTATSDLNTLSNLELTDENNLINTSHLNRFEEEEDYSLLPNDIIEFNNMDDLIDFFNNNNTNNNNNNNNLLSEQSEHLSSNNIMEKNQFKIGSVQTNYTANELAWFFSKNNSSSNNQIDNFGSEKFVFSKQSQSLNQIDSKVSNKNLNINTLTDIDQNRLNELNNCFESKLADDINKMNFDDYFNQLLLYYINEENDLTTTIFMFLVATIKEKFDKSKIEPIYLDEWFSQYIEILAKFELWNLRTEIIKAYQSDAIKSLTQKSLIYTVMCAMCKRTIIQNNFVCNSCKKIAFLCSYCHLPVKRLYAWCHSCCHGGHLDHMLKWFKKNTKCPTGCGCNCSPNFKQNQQNI